MGFQSSRLWFRGADHKDIYFNGKYHDAMYIGDTLVWEKRRALDGWWCLYDGGGYLFLASGESLKTGSKKIMRLRGGAWEYLTSTPDCSDFVTPALRFYGATPAIFDNGGWSDRAPMKLYRNGAWESPFTFSGTSGYFSTTYIFRGAIDANYRQGHLDFYRANDGEYAVTFGSGGYMKYMAALGASGELKLNPANNDATPAADGTEAHCTRQALECRYDYFKLSNNEWYRKVYGMVSIGGRLFVSQYFKNDTVGVSEPTMQYMAEVSVYEAYDESDGKRHLFLHDVQILLRGYYVPLMLEVDGDLLCAWQINHYAGSYTYQLGRLNLSTMQWTYLTLVQIPDNATVSNWVASYGFDANVLMYANGRYYLLYGLNYQTSDDLVTWERHSYQQGIKQYGGSGRVIAGEICGRYLDEDGNYHFGPLGV